MSPQVCVRQSAVSGRSYRVFGYKGKQVRDNIPGFYLVEAFVEFIHAPRSGEVYNIGGSRHSNCSMLEAIALCEEISGRKLTWSYEEDEPSRRPHLVEQRCEEISERLSCLEISLRLARNSGGNLSRSY